jgi:hypothetical protein
MGLEAMESTQDKGKSSELFKKAAERVYVYGYALQRLAHGAALRMHLQSIPPNLLQSNFSPQTQTDTPMPAPGDAEEREESDVELKAVQPFAHVNGSVETRLWKSYVDWLRLIIVHFDSVNVLADYFTRPGIPDEPVTIHILLPAEVSKKLLPWRELFADAKLFPTETTSEDPKHVDITNPDLLKFLTTAVDKIPTSHTHVKALITGRANRNLPSIVESLRKLESSPMPCWGVSATNLLSLLAGSTVVPPRNSPLDRDVSSVVTAISQSATFFNALASMQPDNDFRGTLHCEAFLVSLLHDAAISNQGFAAQMKVGYFFSSRSSQGSHCLWKDAGSTIGVSKGCCPTCRHLIFLLGNARPQPFQYTVRGNHNTITACTLPAWLPENIVDSMNSFVGKLLRRELILLKARTDLSRRRAESSGSRRLSSDSADQANDNDVVISAAMVGDDM